MSAGYVIGIFASEPYVRVSPAVFATLDEARGAVPALQARFDRRLGVARIPTSAECEEHQAFIAAWHKAGGFENDAPVPDARVRRPRAVGMRQMSQRRATLYAPKSTAIQ